MFRTVIVMAFVALATAAAAPVFAREPFTQDCPGDACQAPLRGSYAPGADIKGFARERGGYGQWPTDIVIECFGDPTARGAF
jgi:hypothetical protein